MAAGCQNRAKFACPHGSVSISFNTIPLSIQSVHLTIDVSDVTIHLLPHLHVMKNVFTYFTISWGVANFSILFKRSFISVLPKQRHSSSTQSLGFIHSNYSIILFHPVNFSPLPLKLAALHFSVHWMQFLSSCYFRHYKKTWTILVICNQYTN